MTEIQSKSILKVAGSILVGLVCAALTFFSLILICFATGLWGWSDGGDPEYLRRLELTTNISQVFSVIAAAAMGIYIILRMNRPSRKS